MTPDQARLRLNGAITALVTPFHAGEVDLKGLTRLVRWQIEEGINGLVPCGTTGEAPTLSWEERLDIIGQCVKIACGRVPIIAGTGTSSTEATIGFTTAAEALGADAALIVMPYYNRPSQEGIFRHFEAIARKVSIPIIVYNVPARTGVDLLPADDRTSGGNPHHRRDQGCHRRPQPAIVDFCSRRRPLPAVLRPRSERRSASTCWAVEERFPSSRMWHLDCASRCTMLAGEGTMTPRGRYMIG